jgi:hypothetical protein
MMRGIGAVGRSEKEPSGKRRKRSLHAERVGSPDVEFNQRS